MISFVQKLHPWRQKAVISQFFKSFKNLKNDVIMTGNNQIPRLHTWNKSVVDYLVDWAKNEIVRVLKLKFSNLKRFKLEISAIEYWFLSELCLDKTQTYFLHLVQTQSRLKCGTRHKFGHQKIQIWTKSGLIPVMETSRPC